MSEKIRINRLKKLFKAKYGSLRNVCVYQAPGRVNLVGDHTDYNDGFVLPIALSQNILLLAQPRDDRSLRMSSLNFANEVICDLDDLSYQVKDDWANYPKGIAETLLTLGYSLKGMNLLYEGNIPIASGLSSSAAIEVITCFAFSRQCELNIEPKEIPFICQKAENEFIGMKCGIMDQFVITMAKPKQAMFLDCRSLEFDFVPLIPENIKVVIGNTNVKRSLINSQFNQRRKECEEGVNILQRLTFRAKKTSRRKAKTIRQLRDVSVWQFERWRKSLSQPIKNRCAHVIYENERVCQAVNALKANQFKKLGGIMTQSHESLRRLYQVSCRELNIMVEESLKVKGVFGSRMTGAGFGGCTVSLVKTGAVGEFISKVSAAYEQKTKIKPEFYICQPSSGAKEIKR